MKAKCPDCSEELVMKGYRHLFGYCGNCDKKVHIDDTVKD